MSPSERIDEMIAGIADWRGATLGEVRKTILAADKAIIEEWKWMGSPTWSRDGLIAVGTQRQSMALLSPLRQISNQPRY